MHSRRKEATPSTNCSNDGTKSHIVQICTGTQWQCICAKLTLPFGVKMKIEWLVMKWGCHGKKGQVITNLNCYLTFYFEIELRTTVSDSLNTSHKTFSCLVVEEMFKWKEYTH